MMMKRYVQHTIKKSKVTTMKKEVIYHMKNRKCQRWYLLGLEVQKGKRRHELCQILVWKHICRVLVWRKIKFYTIWRKL